jgi:hypothetical protein
MGTERRWKRAERNQKGIGRGQKMDFKSLINGIRKGEAVTSTALLPYLCAAEKRKRGEVNLMLAEAYADIGNLAQAGVFIRRSWMLSGSSPELLPLYIKIHAGLSDIDAIRAAYKKIGMTEAAKGNVAQALNYFNQWQYAYANHLSIDKYVYDFDILACIRKMAEPWRMGGLAQKKPLTRFDLLI